MKTFKKYMTEAKRSATGRTAFNPNPKRDDDAMASGYSRANDEREDAFEKTLQPLIKMLKKTKHPFAKINYDDDYGTLAVSAAGSAYSGQTQGSNDFGKSSGKRGKVEISIKSSATREFELEDIPIMGLDIRLRITENDDEYIEALVDEAKQSTSLFGVSFDKSFFIANDGNALRLEINTRVKKFVDDKSKSLKILKQLRDILKEA